MNTKSMIALAALCGAVAVNADGIVSSGIVGYYDKPVRTDQCAGFSKHGQ